MSAFIMSASALNGMNVKAQPFYPPGETKKADIAAAIREVENGMYDRMEKVWWIKNKDMFEESVEDELKLKLESYPYIKIKGERFKEVSKVKTIEEECESPSWADIIKKNVV
jgi:hypothetical protein